MRGWGRRKIGERGGRQRLKTGNRMIGQRETDKLGYEEGYEEGERNTRGKLSKLSENGAETA